MWRAVAEKLDLWAIKQACSSVVTKQGDHHEHEAERLLTQPGFFEETVEAPSALRFAQNGRDFSFPSPVTSRWSTNNIVHGRFFRSGPGWQRRPAVILLHGWNSELSYQRQFPFLAWRLNRRGINAAMIELPFHGRRRPSSRSAVNNFISHDLLSMVEATQQALTDTRTLAAWLLAQGCPTVGVWGISLGAWLSGLLLCHDARFSFGALTTPVPNVEVAIRELDFCAPIRVALENHSVDVSRLNLASLRPLVPPGQILLVEAQHDLFAPVQVVEELWKAWNRPHIWRVRHGHISVLMSLPIMERTVRWLENRSRNVQQAAKLNAEDTLR